MRKRVEKILEEIRLILQADGGDVELIDVTEEGIVRIHIRGICATCTSSMVTLKRGIERLVMEQVPEVREVIAL